VKIFKNAEIFKRKSASWAIFFIFFWVNTPKNTQFFEEIAPGGPSIGRKVAR
jgi:hypothetical protein